MSAIATLKTYLECPIYMEQMQEPYMIIPCGHSFEKRAIEHWFSSGNRTCPLDRGNVETLVVNSALKKLIVEINQLSEEEDDVLQKTEKLKEEVLQIRQQATALFWETKLKKKRKIEKSFEKQVAIGFYLLATCKNEECQLVDQSVWVNKNTGKFSANRECNFMQCSSCDQDFEDINTIAIRAMSYSWEGKKVTGEKAHGEIKSIESTHVIFEDLSEWRYLSIVVLPT